MAAGMQERLTAQEVSEVSKRVSPKLKQLLIETIKSLPYERNCPCAHALKDARFR